MELQAAEQIVMLSRPRRICHDLAFLSLQEFSAVRCTANQRYHDESTELIFFYCINIRSECCELTRQQIDKSRSS